MKRSLWAMPNNFAMMMAGSREAELAGRTRVSLDDVLVALLVSGGPAARVLSAHGADLARLRAAVVERDADDLASLGVDPAGVQPSRRTLAEAFTSRRRMDVEPQVEEVFSRLRTEQELLRSLLEHPSGGPDEALRRAGVDVESVLAHQPWPGQPTTERPHPVPGLLDGQRVALTTTVRFLPVPFERVADVVTEPRLVAQWYWQGDEARVDGEVLRFEMGPAGRRMAGEVRRVRLARDAEHVDVTWQTFLDGPAGAAEPSHYMRLEARAEASGAELRITRGVNGRGRFAALARWLSMAFAKTSARTWPQAIVEVAVTGE